MARRARGRSTGPASSTGSPMTFMMRPSVSSPTGTVIGAPVSYDGLAAHQTFGGVHGDAAHGVLAEMLGDFEHQAVAAVLGLQRVQDRRQVAVEMHVDDGADDLARPCRPEPTCAERRLARARRLRRAWPAPWPEPPSPLCRRPSSGSLLSPSSLPFSSCVSLHAGVGRRA